MSENIIAFKTEIDPNEETKAKFENYAKVSKFVFNWGLGHRQWCYKNNIKMTRFDQAKDLGNLKHRLPSEVILNASCKDIPTILKDHNLVADTGGIRIWHSKEFEVFKVYQYGFHIYDVTYPSLCFMSIKEPDYSWLNKYDAVTINAVFQDVDAAYKNFFRRCKKGDKRKGFPKFKRNADSFSVKYQGTKVDGRHILLGTMKHIGWVRIKEKNYIPEFKEGQNPQAVVVSREGDKWFVSVQTPADRIEEVPSSGDASDKYGIKTSAYAGLDLNTNLESRLALCYSDSEYHAIDAPDRFFVMHEKNLKRWQKKLSRCVGARKGEKKSNRFRKILVHVINCQMKIRRARHYFAQRFASEISNKVDVLVIEDLDNKEMIEKKMVDKAGKKLKNRIQHKKNRSQTDAGFGIHRQCLTQQYTKKKKILACVPKKFPSTQNCCRCGNRKIGEDKIPVGNKIYECSVCGSKMNRDDNSSHNLMAVAAVLAETLNARNARGVDIGEEETIEVKIFDRIIPLKILSVKRSTKREAPSSESETMSSSEITEHTNIPHLLPGFKPPGSTIFVGRCW